MCVSDHFIHSSTTGASSCSLYLAVMLCCVTSGEGDGPGQLLGCCSESAVTGRHTEEFVITLNWNCFVCAQLVRCDFLSAVIVANTTLADQWLATLRSSPYLFVFLFYKITIVRRQQWLPKLHLFVSLVHLFPGFFCLACPSYPHFKCNPTLMSLSGSMNL